MFGDTSQAKWTGACGTFMKKTCSTESTGTQCASNYRPSCEIYSVLTHMHVHIIQYHTCPICWYFWKHIILQFKAPIIFRSAGMIKLLLGSVLHRFLDRLVSCTYTLTDIEGSHLYVSESLKKAFKKASMNIIWFHMTCLIWLDLIHMISHHFIWFHHACIMISHGISICIHDLVFSEAGSMTSSPAHGGHNPPPRRLINPWDPWVIIHVLAWCVPGVYGILWGFPSGFMGFIWDLWDETNIFALKTNGWKISFRLPFWGPVLCLFWGVHI